MPRGGARRGVPGRQYRNRSDLRTQKLPVQTAPSTQYGSRVAQERAQQALPMGRPVAPPPAPVAPQGGGGGGAPQAQPPPLPQPVSLTGPTQRPDEPVTAGIDMGAGPGSEVMPQAGGAAADDLVVQLRALYAATQLPELADIIAEL